MEDIATPALLLDLDALTTNRASMCAIMSKYPGVAFRPHLKAHKCEMIARMQVDEDGVCGVCVAKVSEAIVAARAGVRDILLANEIGSVGKAQLLAQLAADYPNVTLRCCIDCHAHIDLIVNALKSFPEARIGLLIEVDVGQHRCGVPPEHVVDLARIIMHRPGVRLDGIQCYNGSLQHVRSYKHRELAVMKVGEMARDCKLRLEEAGFLCPIVTGGGTGTFEFEASSGAFTEVQPGSYLFMDVDYGKNLDEDDECDRRFNNSLFIATTVMSISWGREWAVVDAGTKAVSLDSGPPQVFGLYDLLYRSGGDEHGILYREDGLLPRDLLIGDIVWMIPGHCDPTVNLYDRFTVVSRHQERVIGEWDISARGPGL